MRLAFALVCLATGVVGAGEISELVESSRAARAEGVPQGRVFPLQRALGGDLSVADRREVAVELARCLLAADREIEAVDLLDEPQLLEGDEAKFWLAQALAKAGEFERALSLYREVAELEDEPLVGEALLGKARMLEATGDLNAALGALGDVPKESEVIHPARLNAAALLIEAGGLQDASLALESIRAPSRRDREQKSYLRARIELDKGESAAAVESYTGMEFEDRRLTAGAAIGAAEARLRVGDVNAAERQLEGFLRANPESPLVSELMRKLDEIYAASSDPVNAELKRFEEDTDHATLAALATYYLARNDERTARRGRAARTYREFIRDHPDHPLRGEATVRLTNLLLADGALEAAVRTLDGVREVELPPGDAARIEFLWGRANFEAGNYDQAVGHFLAAAEGAPELTTAALTNAALAGGYGRGDGGAVLDRLREEDPLAAEDVELAAALQRGGRTGSPSLETLRRLSGEAKNPAIRSRARLGIAEWNWLKGEHKRARSNFRQIANGTPTEQTRYFEVYAADDGTPVGAERSLAAAGRFVTEYPDSSRVPEVRMKWGEILARRGDHRGARVQFEGAAELLPDDANRATAHFLAARSAARLIEPEMLEEAVGLFEQARQTATGPLADQALLDQALLFNALRRPAEALELLDQLEKSKEDRLRISALITKGDTQHEMGATDPQRAAQAIATWNRVAEDERATPSERNEALAKAASAHEQADEFDAALAGYYEVLNAPRDTEPEFFWYYKAGFDAARLLIERDQLKEASAIFEKMAATEGPRSAEAAERVKALRLENFIWEN
ncbi:MAG: tetratricopeptide repeat protein [Chthoniobacterales bacterium]